MKITEEKHHSSEGIINDPNARVASVYLDKSTRELEFIFELEEEAKKIVKETLAPTASISISATKPSE